ncbi:hypothetical protein EGJ09_05310 [Pseudomonas sp. p106]|nr:hypothetical protein EGJ09_05310 [Pseudomonas sp. p106]
MCKSHFRGIKHLGLLAIVGARGFSGMGEGDTRNTCRHGRKPAYRSHGPFLKGLTAITKKYME